METVLHMPKYGMTVTQVEVTTWFVEEGDAVEVDTELVEVSENKAVHTLKSKVNGVITKILVAEGEKVEPGTDLAIINVEG